MLELAYWAGVLGYILLGTSLFWIIKIWTNYNIIMISKGFLAQQAVGAFLVMWYHIDIGSSMPGSTALYFINFTFASVLLGYVSYIDYRSKVTLDKIMEKIKESEDEQEKRK